VRQEPAKTEPSSDVRSFTRGQRLKASLIGGAGYFAISLIGRTVRWRSEGDQYLQEIYDAKSRAIHALEVPVIPINDPPIRIFPSCCNAMSDNS